MEQVKASKPPQDGSISRAVVNTGWALNRKMADGEKSAKAHPAAKGEQEPDLNGGNVDTPRRVRPRPPHLRVISLGTLIDLEPRR